MTIQFLVDDGEAVQRGDDDALLVIVGVLEF